ncbi:MAG: FAD-dependent oxidoreductase [Paludibacteraceae bacterium]|nr:FAD-dependent oxidoreductase [Paludibacteraceae bacterium]
MDIIIGAGVTGLTYANFTKNPYLILEADDHTGGLCNTICQDGFVWDYSGHFFHFQNPEIAQFISERLDKSGLVEVEKHTQIRYKDRLIDFPFQKNIHQLEQQEFIDCLVDLFEANSITPTTFKEMLYTKFGKSIAEKFLIPYNEKLYATDLNMLDADAMGRFFPYADKEDIIRNFRKAENSSYNGSFLYHRGGAIQYVKALERDIPIENISLQERVTHIDLQQQKVTTIKREIKYDHLISTIPLINLLPLCGINVDTTALSWNKVLVFNLGFDGLGPDKQNHWIYFPEKKYCFYRVGFYSNIIPSDRMSLYVEIGYQHDAVVDEKAMLQQTLNGLREAGILTNQNLVSYHSVVMNPAYVHVSQKGIQEVSKYKDILAAYNVSSIGRYGSWNYSSIEDNMKEAINLSYK